MYPGTHAAGRGSALAVALHGGGSQTFAELDRRSMRLARALRRRGVGEASTVAVLLENRLEWAEAVWAPLRSGQWVAPLNWHLGADELAYLLQDSGAAAVITSRQRADEFASVLASSAPDVVLVMDGPGEIGEDYEAALASEGDEPLGRERLGARLLYSSGTTGRPKGIRQPLPGIHPADTPPRLGALVARLGLHQDSVFLNAAPAYHAAPFQFGLIIASLGAQCVHLAKFDAGQYLAAVEQHRVTHAQVVPTMMVRLMRLPEDVRNRYDLSSLEVMVTSGAPCAPELKSAVAHWLGPVVHEYYGASEGYGQTHVSPAEAAARPGTVGRALTGQIHIADDSGDELAAGEVGTVWFSGTSAFAYDGDEDKTQQARDPRGWSTVGDLGRLDEEGFLYLTGRQGHTIISGGVNIYPQEVEDALMSHPAVLDVAVFGIPDAEYGEAVKALVQLDVGQQGSPRLVPELVEHVRARLARYKAPKSIDVVERLPRLPSGKLNKNSLRAAYWPQVPPAVSGDAAGRVPTVLERRT